MLVRIKWIQGVGHLHDVAGGKHALARLTLVHGGNGAGKSTLAAVLKALGEGEPSRLADRPTLGGTTSPSVSVQTSKGVVEYDGDAWSMTFPDIHVFDSTFVNENVYSGATVQVDHRKRLLEFAIGDEAAAASQLAAKAASKSSASSRAISETKRELSGYHSGMDFERFRELPQREDAEERIAVLRRQLTEADRIEALSRRRLPSEVPMPSLDLEHIAAVLESSLEQAHETARTLVLEHVQTLRGDGGEAWLRKGIELAHGDECPYCGQETSGLELVDAYRVFFDDRYARHQDAVDALPGLVDRLAGQDVAQSVAQSLEREAAVADAWSEDLSVDQVQVPSERIRQDFSTLHRLLSELVEIKRARADERVSREYLEDSKAAVRRVKEAISEVNKKLADVRVQAESFVSGLDGIDRGEVDGEIRELELSRVRHSESVVALVGKLEEQEGAKAKAEEETERQRENLNAQMAKALDGYLDEINSLLQNFGAPFAIRSMKTDYRGGAPKANCLIELRGNPVELSGDEPTFSTALSDGDKRTLAFAFFLARVKKDNGLSNRIIVLDDNGLSNRIIVLDDPVSSLDRTRRRASLTEIVHLCSEAQQVIVLSHDAHFLRDIERSAMKDKGLTCCTLQLATDSLGYAAIESCDLVTACAGAYEEAHQVLSEYVVEGRESIGLRSIARCIRPMLEGYLRRRFPNRFDSQSIMLGKMISAINDATESDPLRAATSQVNELRSVAEFAGDFHHDSNPNADYAPIDPGELKTYARRALDIVHGW